MEPQNHSIRQRTAHYTDTIHTLYIRYRGTTEPKSWQNQRTQPLTMEPQNHNNIQRTANSQRHNTYSVLTILRNHRTKVMEELENLALNYGTEEPQHYKNNCTLHRDTIHKLYLQYRGTTEPKSWQNQRTQPLTMELQNHNIIKTTAHYTDTIHTLYLRYRGTTEPKSWQNQSTQPLTKEPQNHSITKRTAHYTDTIHTLYLRYRGTTEPKLWQNQRTQPLTMELQNHNITKRTAHYTETQYTHCTYDTEEPPNQSRGRTREPSP